MNQFIKTLIGILICLVFTGPLLSAPQENGEEDNANQQSERSFDERMKEARRPLQFIMIGYMDVHDGQEEAYLEVEADWKKIHDVMAAQGKIVGWGVAKARENKFGYEYITWTLLNSREVLDRLYDMDAIKKQMGAEKFDALMEKTGKTRTIVGRELLSLEDYTVDQLEKAGRELGDDKEPRAEDVSFSMDYMYPAEGKDAEYVAMEKDIFQPMKQYDVDNNPRFLGWRLQQKLMSSGKTNPAPYRVVNIYRRDVPELSEAQREKIDANAPKLPEDMSYEKVMELRKMEPVRFDVAYRTDRSESAEAKAWEEIQGSWTHTYDDGSYRVKIITPYSETLQNYNAEGKLVREGTSPMSIAVKGGIKHFSTHHPNGTWNGIYEMHDGKWYEQMRGIFHNVSGEPNKFLIYSKGDSSSDDDSSDNKQTSAAPSDDATADTELKSSSQPTTSSRRFGSRLRDLRSRLSRGR
ncbi:MAG: hypothetical protein GY768_18310 [Planctomycetaceae bacterium]|nr:hypothetical protein [Planctomycetaceae bacterium]